MALRDLREYLDYLDRRGCLARVGEELSPVLEIPEVLRQAMYRRGPALLFERVKGHPGWRVAGNIFCSLDALKGALGVGSLEEVGDRLLAPMRGPPPEGLGGKVRALREVVGLARYLPRKARRGPVMEEEGAPPERGLEWLPAFKVSPGDGGRYLTYPLVIVRHPDTGVVTMSVYRVMVVGQDRGVVHWQAHKRGRAAELEARRRGLDRLPAAIAIGADPGTLLTGALPVPYPMDKLLFAGIVRGEGVEVVELPNGVPVPARAEVVLEGYIDLRDLRREGPYGDHFGYYDRPDRLFPTFVVERVYHRGDPIYYGSVTGKPPLEDVVIGKAAERIFLPIIRTLLPEVVDVNLPPHGVFQGIGIVSIRKSYPGHAKKVMMALWGLGQMALTKILVVVDDDINVHDLGQVLWAVAAHVDPQRDVLVVPYTHTDELDPSTPTPRYGSKLGIDATRKLPEEYGGREWPEEVEPDPRVLEKALRVLDSLGVRGGGAG